MTTVDRWTGREAKLLRQALRLSVRDFAANLGIGVRTVNKWEARQADITPLPHMQEVLDTALALASDEVKARFAAATRPDVPERQTGQLPGQPVRSVMLPVVVNGRVMFTPVDADALAVAPLVGHADVEPLERLASAARQPSRVDPVTVEHLELITQAHRSLYTTSALTS